MVELVETGRDTIGTNVSPQLEGIAVDDNVKDQGACIVDGQYLCCEQRDEAIAASSAVFAAAATFTAHGPFPHHGCRCYAASDRC